jgi:hypothetical protein
MVLFLNLVWLIALVSYTMTWREDQSLFLETSWKSLWTADAETQNWLGRLGAFLGHWTVYRGWGLGVVFLWFWTLLLGLKLLFSDFKVKLVARAFDALFFASIVSVTLAFLFHACWTLPFPWGGAFGRFAVGWASGFVGLVGTGLALSGFWFAWLMIRRGKRLQWPVLHQEKASVAGAVQEPVAKVSVSNTMPNPPALPILEHPEPLPWEDETAGEPTEDETAGEPTEDVMAVAPMEAGVAGLEVESDEDWATLGKIGDMEVALPDAEEVLEDAHTVALTDSDRSGSISSTARETLVLPTPGAEDSTRHTPRRFIASLIPHSPPVRAAARSPPSARAPAASARRWRIWSRAYSLPARIPG